jgi:predicted DNA-binding antitoxin AbrB/MazE fold protein
MRDTIQAVYENGVLRPLQPPGLQEHQQVYLLVLPEDPSALALSQRQALADVIGLGASGQQTISTDHNTFLYRKG